MNNGAWSQAKGSVAVLSSASAGGAGIASKRLVEALDAHTALNVDYIHGENLGEFLPGDVAPMDSFANRKISDTHYTVEYPGYWRGWLVQMLSRYDVINVHWAVYLVSLAELMAVARTGRTLVLTCHDFNYATGGCHYPATCTRMAVGCRACPQVDAARVDAGLIPKIQGIKRELLSYPNVHLVAPSAYLRDTVVATGIVAPERAHVIRNPYDPLYPAVAAPDPETVRILLIADSFAERRKNMALALKALAVLADRLKSQPDAPNVAVELVGRGDNTVSAQMGAIGLEVATHGMVREHDKLSRIFQRSDILLTPSLEDNWPNVLAESGVYGAIPVTGPGHGCEEFVRTFNYGAVARDYSPEAFADALMTALEIRARTLAKPALRQSAIKAMRDTHAPETIARRFVVQFVEDGREDRAVGASPAAQPVAAQPSAAALPGAPVSRRAGAGAAHAVP